jgi:hypothetical protein
MKFATHAKVNTSSLTLATTKPATHTNSMPNTSGNVEDEFQNRVRTTQDASTKMIAAVELLTQTEEVRRKK